MKILFITSDLPIPQTMPGSPRLHEFCRILSERHEIELGFIGIATPAINSFHANFPLLHKCHPVSLASLPPSISIGGRLLHRILDAPFFFEKFRRPRYFKETLRKLNSHIEMSVPDVIVGYGIGVSTYLANLDKKPVVYDFVDSISLLYERMSAQEQNTVRRSSLIAESQSILKWEKRILNTGAPILVVSEYDRQHLLTLSPSADVRVIPIGVDYNFFSPALYSEPVMKHRVVFTGNMGYTPNRDAALFFARQIFPLIKAEVQDAEFYVVGANADKELQDLQLIDGITVTGFVEDVRPFVLSAPIFVSPLRIGAGMKIKLLQAASMERAIVATAMSLEGLDFQVGREILVADTPESISESITNLFRQPNNIQLLGKNARKKVIQNHSWEKATFDLEATLQKAQP